MVEKKREAQELRRDERVIALKRERAGYVARGEADRVAEVDAAIARELGENTESPVETATAKPERATRTRKATATKRKPKAST